MQNYCLFDFLQKIVFLNKTFIEQSVFNTKQSVQNLNFLIVLQTNFALNQVYKKTFLIFGFQIKNFLEFACFSYQKQ